MSSQATDQEKSIAVISSQIDGLKELMLEKLSNQDKELSLIKDQTTKTNGHVADAFREIANLNAFKNKTVGALLVSNAFFVPTILFLLFRQFR